MQCMYVAYKVYRPPTREDDWLVYLLNPQGQWRQFKCGTFEYFQPSPMVLFHFIPSYLIIHSC